MGDYFFSDLAGGWIHRIDPTTKAVSQFATGVNGSVDLKVDGDGNLYGLERNSGDVIEISHFPRHGASTIGLYDPPTSVFYLKNSNTTGFADNAFAYGAAQTGWLAVSGDWDGNGTDTLGLYNRDVHVLLAEQQRRRLLRSHFCLRPGEFQLSCPSPAIGTATARTRWDSTTGRASVFYLRNTNNGGFADLAFSYGPSGESWNPACRRLERGWDEFDRTL